MRVAGPFFDRMALPAGRAVPAAPLGYWRTVWRRFTRHKLAVAGGAVAMVLLLSAIGASWIAPYRFEAIDLMNLFKPPGSAHVLGTDEVGHDVFSRIVYAGRVSLTVGLVAAVVSNIVGVGIGLLAGHAGGAADAALMRLTDVFISVPSIAMMFILAKFLGPGLRSIVVVLSAFGWMATARLVRGEILRLGSQDFVSAARALGASDLRLMLRHLLPNAMAPIIVATTLLVGQAIINESTISYFGLGLQPPVPSWGNMLQNAQEYLWTAPWLAVYPGFFIFLTVLAFNFLGDGLRDALDPRLKR